MADTDMQDRGDNLDLPEDAKPAPAPDTSDQDLKEVLGDKEGDDKDDKKVDTSDDKPRDDKGRFEKKEKEAVVPKHRFDEAVQKEREAREAAERRLAEATAKLKTEEEQIDVKKISDEIKELNKQHSKLLLDGEHEKASEVMDRIQSKIEERAELRNNAKFSKATAQAVEQVRWDAAVAQLESSYPQFNKDSESFDQDLVDLTIAEQRRLMSQEGLSASAAILKAGTKIMTKFGSSADKKAEPKGLDAAKDGDRKSKQVEKNLDTDKRQAPSMKDTGTDSDKIGKTKSDEDISKMTPEEIAALPASTRARLRGDTL